MNKLTVDFIKRNLKKYDIKPTSVLDIGSIDINGSPRHLFDCEYTGVDRVEGKNVDVVRRGEDYILEYEGSGHDVLLCLNTMEHTNNFWHLSECIRLHLEKGSYYFMSVPTVGFPVHQQPDYYRFTEQAVREVLMKSFEVLELEQISSKFRLDEKGNRVSIN